MNFFDLILFLLVFAVFLFAIISKIKKISFRADFLIYLAPLVFSIVHLIVCGLNYFLIPVMISTVFIPLLYPAKKRWLSFVPVALLSAVLALASVLLPVSENMQNYASFSYVDSFNKLNTYLENVYPLADHKKVDFSMKYTQFLPQFEAAQRNQDKKAYFQALSDYIASFSDAHMVSYPADVFLGLSFSKEEFLGWRESDLGGDLGFATIRTDDGRAVAVAVDENSDVYAAGLRVGNEILTVDGREIAEVAQEIPMVFAPQGSADAANRLILQHMMIGRCPVGNRVTITFSKEDGSVVEATLVAVQKDYNALKETFDTLLQAEPETVEDLYSFQVLESQTGYMRIGTMEYEDEAVILKQVEEDLANFANGGGENLILDVRQNGGGEDTFGAKLKGLFTDKKDFYLTESVLDQKTGQLVAESTITVEPKFAGFDGQIIILVNAGSASAAEGFAYNMAELSNVSVAGMMGSNGSFGTMTDGFVLLPDNFLLIFPKIACVDENGRVMIDADASGFGGVKPDIKIPIDDAAIDSLFVQHVDYELNFVLEYLNTGKTAE